MHLQEDFSNIRAQAEKSMQTPTAVLIFYLEANSGASIVRKVHH